jgi:hypothetical protein
MATRKVISVPTKLRCMQNQDRTHYCSIAAKGRAGKAV